jgi:putative membrane protein
MAMPIRDTIVPLASSRTLGYVALCALLLGVYSVLPIWKEYSRFRDLGDTPSDLHAALSLILGLLLVFRTNAAYGRWWEARILWGGLVNASRNLAMKLVTVGRLQFEEMAPCEQLLKEFPAALMNHLRCSSSQAAATAAAPAHRPLQIAQQLYDWLAERKLSHKIDGDELRVIDVELAKLMEICGACERIAKTPMIGSYRVFARQCILLFLLTLPWGIANDFGWWTIPLTIITAYFMIGLEVVAEHVEEPFGLDEDDLDLESICLTIDKSIHEVFATHAMKG